MAFLRYFLFFTDRVCRCVPRQPPVRLRRKHPQGSFIRLQFCCSDFESHRRDAINGVRVIDFT